MNSGVGRAGRVLRRVLGLPDDTWAVTDDIKAEVARRDPRAVIAAINAERLAFLRSLRTWPVFGTGWERRVGDVRDFSLPIADQAQTAPAPPGVVAAIGKGAIPQPRIMKAAITQGVPAAAAMTAFGFIDWVSAHPWTSIGLAAVGLTSHVPSWAWPLVLISTTALFQFLRNLSDARHKAELTSGSTQLQEGQA